MSTLFEPYDLAGLALPNRVVMAPMTRSRARLAVADEQTALYYCQRASTGLIVMEGSQVSVEGRGYLFTPGMHTDEQVAGWRKVTEAVHCAGGRIFAQLWHAGCISHVSLQVKGEHPVSSVSRAVVGATASAYDMSGVPNAVHVGRPRAITTFEIGRVVSDFVKAANNAMAAGFDGVELNAANGYLFDQFLNGALNTRSDRYGGHRIDNRVRFVLETLDAVSFAIGPPKTGIRLSPFGRLHDMRITPAKTRHGSRLPTSCPLANLPMCTFNLEPLGRTPKRLWSATLQDAEPQDKKWSRGSGAPYRSKFVGISTTSRMVNPRCRVSMNSMASATSLGSMRLPASLASFNFSSGQSARRALITGPGETEPTLMPCLKTCRRTVCTKQLIAHFDEA